MRRLTGLALAAPATLWLLLAFAAPLVVVVIMSLQGDSDPLAPLTAHLSLAQYATLFTDPYYVSIMLRTTGLAVAVCAAVTVLAYPTALWILSVKASLRPLAIATVLTPLLVNVVVRSLGIQLLLAPDGLVNGVLGLLGIPPAKHLLYNYFSIGVGLAQVFLPFMVLALYDVLQSTPPRVMEAAQSLGATRSARFLDVQLPLSIPGLKSGATFVFLMASTTYVSARMLGGKVAWTTGMVVWQEVLENLNSQFASALALVMTALSLLAAFLIALAARRATPWLAGRAAAASARPAWLSAALDKVLPVLAGVALAISLLLLVLPLVLVLVQSFNDVPQASAAGFRGFTLKWYRQLFSTGLYFDSFATSVQLALATAVATALLAAPAAFAIVRHDFPGKTALQAFWTLPIALPQIAIGVGMLRLLQAFAFLPTFVSMLMAHAVIAMPFCIGLLTASVQGLDRSQEEAAANLGAGPLKRLLLVILPGLAPGLAAAAIVAFLLSFEEVTVTSFLTTARMTTLPVRIYAEASDSLEPTVFCISTFLIVMTVLALAGLGRLVRLDRVFSR